MPAPTNFTLLSLFFQFLQVFRQLVYVGVGEGVGFGKGGYEVAGAAAEKATPQTALNSFFTAQTFRIYFSLFYHFVFFL